MRSRSAAKQRIRQQVWDAMQRDRVARFPFPPHGRIPNFEGARQAAERLFQTPWMQAVRLIKVNPDAPQLPVRVLALRRGITVYVPTPRLRGGFFQLDPRKIPEKEIRKAASLTGMKDYASEVALGRMRTPDLLVVGSVAVTKRGARVGKGEGYADLEYGILRELGHPEMPVVTTVHDSQVVKGLRREATDLPISWIVTPEASYRIPPHGEIPKGIDWSRLDDEDLEAMPVLAKLRKRRR